MLLKELKNRAALLAVQERMMAERESAKTIEVTADHVSYISDPNETARLIQGAATSTHVN
jgi:hypothetical protein